MTPPLTGAKPVRAADSRDQSGPALLGTADKAAIDRQRSVPYGPKPTPWVEELADLGGWRSYALCRGLGSELFFPVGEVGPAAVDQAAAAKAVCRSCPVREPCLEFSLATNQEFGVWGGLDDGERRPLRQARRGLGAGMGAQPTYAAGAVRRVPGKGA